MADSGRTDLLGTYNRSDYLDAKWGVMRRYRVSKTAFEDWVIDLLDPRPSDVVLDIGAGSGRFTLPIARRLTGGRVDALDVSRGVMESVETTSAAEALAVKTIVADVETYDVGDVRYDAILAGHMIYHLHHPVETLRRMRAALCAGGQFVATTNARGGMPEFYALYRQTLELLDLPIPEPETEANEFSSENGAEVLGRVFSSVRAEQYDGGFVAPNGVAVLTYFASTQLYRRPMNDERLSLEVRARLAPTYAAIAQSAVDAAGGRLLISKPMTVFFCQP